MYGRLPGVLYPDGSRELPDLRQVRGSAAHRRQPLQGQSLRWAWTTTPTLAVPCHHHVVSITLFPSLGPSLSGGSSLRETSSVLVETVTKSSSGMAGAFASLPKFSSDASKVVSRGAGLSKAFVGQKNSFIVDCSKAGRHKSHKYVKSTQRLMIVHECNCWYVHPTHHQKKTRNGRSP